MTGMTLAEFRGRYHTHRVTAAGCDYEMDTETGAYCEAGSFDPILTPDTAHLVGDVSRADGPGEFRWVATGPGIDLTVYGIDGRN